MKDLSNLTLRMPRDRLAIFTAICALNKISASDVLRDAVENYIKANKDVLKNCEP